jgi:GTP-binding protein
MLDEDLIRDIKKDLPKIPFVFISAVAEQGLTELKDLIWENLNNE